jgi:hypothetical protein
MSPWLSSALGVVPLHRNTHTIMTTLRQSIPFLAGIVAALFHSSALAQQPVITSFHANGQLTWTNIAGTNGFTVQWAPAVTGPWSSNWQALDSIISTGAQTTASVPMFYRVVQGFSLASMRGLWIAASPVSGNVYFRAEDNGLLSEVGIFTLRTPNGYFTVTPSGAVTVTFLPKDGPFSFTGQIGQPTNALGTLFRVGNAALCSGTWTGSLSQTSGPGSPLTYPVSFEVDSSGWIVNFVGFSPVVTGRLYAVTNGPTAAFITTGDSGAYNQIQISGTLTGNSITGSYEADQSSVAGTVSLTRQ